MFSFLFRRDFLIFFSAVVARSILLENKLRTQSTTLLRKKFRNREETQLLVFGIQLRYFPR